MFYVKRDKCVGYLSQITQETKNYAKGKRVEWRMGLVMPLRIGEGRMRSRMGIGVADGVDRDGEGWELELVA